MTKKDDLEKEIFSLKSTLIILTIHLFGVYGLQFITLKNLSYLIFSFYFFIIIGASVTLHNYLSHKNFEFRFKILRIICLFVATCCLQGAPALWASHHFNHHCYTDKFKDPHTRIRGFFWSHIGWLFYKNPNGYSQTSTIKYCKNLLRDPVIYFFNHNYLSINLFFLSLLLIICKVINRIDLFYLIGPLRIVCVWHATWALNSFGHVIDDKGNSILCDNSIILKLLIPGEHQHSAHHSSPRHLENNNILYMMEKLKLILKVPIG